MGATLCWRDVVLYGLEKRTGLLSKQERFGIRARRLAARLGTVIAVGKPDELLDPYIILLLFGRYRMPMFSDKEASDLATDSHELLERILASIPNLKPPPTRGDNDGLYLQQVCYWLGEVAPGFPEQSLQLGEEVKLSEVLEWAKGTLEVSQMPQPTLRPGVGRGHFPASKAEHESEDGTDYESEKDYDGAFAARNGLMHYLKVITCWQGIRGWIH